MRLILASASPRRAELLRAAGFEFDTIVADVDESVRHGEAPSTYVRRLAAEKSAAAASLVVSGFQLSRPDEMRARSRSVASGFSRTSEDGDVHGSRFVASGFSRTSEDGGVHGPPEGGHHVREKVILAADTAVIVNGTILGKPQDDADAARMLRALAGRRHEVLTGVSLRRNAYEVGRVETTAVFFTPLADGEVAWYVASGEGRDKAGGYAIQGLASRFIRRIEGSYSNVVGLPVAAVVELLRETGIMADG